MGLLHRNLLFFSGGRLCDAVPVVWLVEGRRIRNATVVSNCVCLELNTAMLFDGDSVSASQQVTANRPWVAPELWECAEEAASVEKVPVVAKAWRRQRLMGAAVALAWAQLPSPQAVRVPDVEGMVSIPTALQTSVWQAMV